MAQLTSITSAGSGMVGVILPDVTTSARYTSYDLPYLTQAFTAAGYTSGQFKIDNASGTTTTEVAIAQADITAGAKVLLVDPLDGPTGLAIQTLAAAASIPYISYDRATFQGTTTYYVSFDNVQVGKLIGQGFMECVTALEGRQPPGLRAGRRQGHRPERHLVRRWLQQRHLGHCPDGQRADRRRHDQQRRLSRSSATRSPPDGTTPRARPSSRRPSRPTPRSTPPSRPMTGSPTP